MRKFTKYNKFPNAFSIRERRLVYQETPDSGPEEDNTEKLKRSAGRLLDSVSNILDLVTEAADGVTSVVKKVTHYTNYGLERLSDWFNDPGAPDKSLDIYMDEAFIFGPNAIFTNPETIMTTEAGVDAGVAQAYVGFLDIKIHQLNLMLSAARAQESSLREIYMERYEKFKKNEDELERLNGIVAIYEQSTKGGRHSASSGLSASRQYQRALKDLKNLEKECGVEKVNGQYDIVVEVPEFKIVQTNVPTTHMSKKARMLVLTGKMKKVHLYDHYSKLVDFYKPELDNINKLAKEREKYVYLKDIALMEIQDNKEELENFKKYTDGVKAKVKQYKAMNKQKYENFKASVGGGSSTTPAPRPTPGPGPRPVPTPSPTPDPDEGEEVIHPTFNRRKR